MTYFTSDTHFYHKNIIKYCSRPWKTTHEMNEGLITLWNQIVKPEDTVYILGDFSFHNSNERIKQLTNRLNGNKILIKGNHDNKIKETNYKELGFVNLLNSEKIYLEDGTQINISHYPYKNEGDHTKIERFYDKRLSDDGNWLLCGHVHTSWKRKKRMINVGVDMWGFQPISLDLIKGIINYKEEE